MLTQSSICLILFMLSDFYPRFFGHMKQAPEALGHSSIAVTADVYGHLLAPSTATADAMAHVMYGT